MSTETLVNLMDAHASDTRPFLISPETGAQLSFQRFREEAHRLARQIAGQGISRGDRVAIVGNSWGGHTALEVLQQLGTGEAPLAVHLVVFLDASSTGRGPARPKACGPRSPCASREAPS